MGNDRSPKQRIRARALTALAAMALVALLTLSELTAPADARLYDALSMRAAPQANERIVVVAVDEKSLAELGRWPWSRRVHARLVDRLTAIGVRGVALDFLLAEPALYDPEGDALLAKALARNGRSVLPVYAEAEKADGPVVELLPIPEFAASAAALGHAEQAADGDGVTRGMALRAGLGSPHWPSLALALKSLGDDTAKPQLPGLHTDGENGAGDAQRWMRDYLTLVPYVRPANGFRQVSFADVLAGHVADAVLRDHWILVGATAAGMGEGLLAPGRRNGDPPLPDVYYQANALNMLLTGSAITPMGLPARIALSFTLVVLPLLLLGLPGLRTPWRPLAAVLAATVLASVLLLATARLWFPPFAVVLVLALGLALSGARRLQRSRWAAATDPLTGLANRAAFDATLEQELRAVGRNRQPLSLLLVDVDRFKQLKAGFGPAASDAALRTLADTLRARARRPRDLVARTGDDEFAVLLPETPQQSAAAIATTLHVDLASLPSKRIGDPVPSAQLTVSIGIHTLLPGGDDATAADFMGRADDALCQAKRLGRNRSHVYTDALAGMDAGT